MRSLTASRHAALMLILAAAAVSAIPTDRYRPVGTQVLATSGQFSQKEIDTLIKKIDRLIPVVPMSNPEHRSVLQLPVACLHKDYMMQSKNLTLDSIANIANSPACHRDAIEGAKLLSRLKQRLAALQQGSTCRTHALSTTEIFNTGFGGTMHSLIKPLMYKFAQNLTMLTPRMDGWTGKECGWSLACFFQTLAPACEGTDPLMVTQISEKLRKEVKVKVVKVWGTSFAGEDPDSDEAFAEDLKLVQKSTPEIHNFVNQNMSHFWHGDSVIPEELRPMGWFRYMTQLQGYVWRPSERLQAKLDDAMRVTGLTEALNAGPVIGMHIRHGDACGDDYRVRGRLCAPLKKYMEFADLLRAQTGASTIYLATDSKFVLNDTKRFPEYKFLNWPASIEFKQKLRSVLNTKMLNWDTVYSDNIGNKHWDYNRELADTSIIDMMLLSKAHLFVGQSTSNFYRTALELKSSSCDCIPAFYSLDSPWCFDFAVKAGKNVYSDDVANKWMC